MKKQLILKYILILIVAFMVVQFGIKPMLGKETYLQGKENNNWAKSRLTHEKGVYDVIVIGEEPEGIAAAVSAARIGAKTLLISEGKDLGGVVARSLYTNPGAGRGEKGELLQKGIFKELYDTLGDSFSVDKYKEKVSTLVRDEKNLDTIYEIGLESPVLQNNTLTGINVVEKGKKKAYKGKRFIDATEDGKLLKMSGVPFLTGSEDLNLREKFMPAKFNFMLEGVEWSEAKSAVEANLSQFYLYLSKYQPSHLNININGFAVSDQGNGKVVVQGIEVRGLDVSDRRAVADAYKDAVDEARKLTKYLAAEFKAFKDAKFNMPADELYISEYRHFVGEHTLGVNEILENTDPYDTVAIGSYPIDASKLVDGGKGYILGRPVQYGIPLECLIPQKVDGLLMVGNKISYSSLASSSAGTMAVSIATGEAAGVAAVYSILNNITPRDLAKNKDLSKIDQLQRLLKRQGMYLPKFDIKNSNVSSWVYPSIRHLNSLGLIAGGLSNNYNLESQATEQDLAMLLINGIYRLSPEKYSLELDARLRSHFTKDKLTKAKAGEILTDMYGINIDMDGAYDRACQLGYINSEMQLRLTKPEDKKVLTMEDVFYLAAQNIKQFTGKNMPE